MLVHSSEHLKGCSKCVSWCGEQFLLCWQGVTLTDLKEAEKTVAKTADPPPRTIQPVSPIVTLTPAERGK